MNVSVRRLQLRGAAPWVGAAVGLMLVGALVGHVVAPPPVPPSPVLELPKVTVSAPGAAGTQVAMPDLLGLERSIALRVLRDAGYTGKVDFRTQPAAGAADRVVAQRPDPEAALGPARASATGAAALSEASPVTITVATSAQMPNLRSKTVDEARTALEQLGAVVTVRRVVRPGAPAGKVASTVPAAGRPVPYAVSVDVNDPGESVSLAQLQAVDTRGCREDDKLSVDGQRVGPSIACRPQRDAPAGGTWNLGRKAALLTFRVGIEDAGATAPVHLRVLGDGKVLLDRNVVFGRSTPTQLAVAGVLRLQVQATTRTEDDPVLVLGDAALVGRTEDLADLQGLR